MRLAAEKARKVHSEWPISNRRGQARFHPGCRYGGALGRRILPKAADDDEVRACLGLLSGRRHQVITAVALVTPEENCAAVWR